MFFFNAFLLPSYHVFAWLAWGSEVLPDLATSHTLQALSEDFPRVFFRFSQVFRGFSSDLSLVDPWGFCIKYRGRRQCLGGLVSRGAVEGSKAKCREWKVGGPRDLVLGQKENPQAGPQVLGLHFSFANRIFLGTFFVTFAPLKDSKSWNVQDWKKRLSGLQGSSIRIWELWVDWRDQKGCLQLGCKFQFPLKSLYTVDVGFINQTRHPTKIDRLFLKEDVSKRGVKKSKSPHQINHFWIVFWLKRASEFFFAVAKFKEC